MRPLTDEEVRTVLLDEHLGHLGMSRGTETYVFPLYYAYDGRTIYMRPHHGLKHLSIDSEGASCLAVTRVGGLDDRKSVLAFGRVERVDVEEAPKAITALASTGLPPSWGEDPAGQPRHGSADLFLWKLTPERITGRRSRGAAQPGPKRTEPSLKGELPPH